VRRLEDHVPAGDERLDVLEAELLEKLLEAIHLDGVTAKVDAAQQRDVSRHAAAT
jgi:hypothetical protein